VALCAAGFFFGSQAVLIPTTNLTYLNLSPFRLFFAKTSKKAKRIVFLHNFQSPSIISNQNEKKHFNLYAIGHVIHDKSTAMD